MHLALRIAQWARGLLGYALKFGLVGLVGVGIDFAVFNVLSLYWRVNDESDLGPLAAKTVSVAISTIFTWLGNRYWTFRAHRRKDYFREAFEFGLVSLGGLFVSLFCLWISHYVLGFTSLLADNIAANVIGFGLATSFRFFLYRYWVYSNHRNNGLQVSANIAEAAFAVLFEDEKFVNHDFNKRN